MANGDPGVLQAAIIKVRQQLGKAEANNTKALRKKGGDFRPNIRPNVAAADEGTTTDTGDEVAHAGQGAGRVVAAVDRAKRSVAQPRRAEALTSAPRADMARSRTEAASTLISASLRMLEPIFVRNTWFGSLRNTWFCAGR